MSQHTRGEMALFAQQFLEEPQPILDWRVVMLLNRDVSQVKVQWKHFNPEEVTWELEDAFKE